MALGHRTGKRVRPSPGHPLTNRTYPNNPGRTEKPPGQWNPAKPARHAATAPTHHPKTHTKTTAQPNSRAQPYPREKSRLDPARQARGPSRAEFPAAHRYGLSRHEPRSCADRDVSAPPALLPHPRQCAPSARTPPARNYPLSAPNRTLNPQKPQDSELPPKNPAHHVLSRAGAAGRSRTVVGVRNGGHVVTSPEVFHHDFF